MFQRIRKLVFWAHLVAGVSAGLLILMMASTGVLLSFERQITEATDGFKLEPATKPANPEGLVSLRQSDLKGATGLMVFSDATQPAAFQFGKEKTLFVHPETGVVLGEGAKKTRAFFQFVTGLHRWLAMKSDSQELGKNITSAAALVFFFLILSGLVIWIPKRWTRQGVKVIATFQRQLKGRARDWNWHNVLGIWFALPLLVITSTGLVIGYPWANNLVFRLAGENPPPPKGKGAPPGGMASAAISTTGWNAAFATVQGRSPGWQSIQFQFPQGGGKEGVFQVFHSHRGRPDLRQVVTVDLASGEVRKVERFEDQSAGRRWRTWIRWIHTGEAGGWAGQLLAGLSAVAAITLVWTGLALAWRRWRRSRG
ncbi:PepSY domain-containing protein [Luteolibacter arcticus]|uniref:PepSY domain-containing protein n=1 Tax=Luteolibacter arcticus TaxID=1581411 RepID=A0ABT3GI73_9BACT|nr:PepSY-associated TM helix domain-containing protein [Luteolibacter arcticus]MCW1923199.1 PepSY domain-containing protein [Luteolibacter arcticus]